MLKYLLLISMLIGLVYCAPYANNGVYDSIDFLFGCLLICLVGFLLYMMFSLEQLFLWRRPIYSGCGVYPSYGTCIYGDNSYGSFSRSSTTTTTNSSNPITPSSHTSTSFASTKRR